MACSPSLYFLLLFLLLMICYASDRTLDNIIKDRNAPLEQNLRSMPRSLTNKTTSSSQTSKAPPASTITPAPKAISSGSFNPQWGNQTIPGNTCTSYSNGVEVWQHCYISAGSVHLSFWPADTNYTYPSTVYDEKLDYTFTSPSVYFVIQTLMAHNDCGNLGPTATNIVFPFDLDKVSTIVPFESGDSTTRLGTRPLSLSDLATDCPGEPPTSTDQNYFYTKNAVNRCNPRLTFPMDIKYWGMPYYNHCQFQENKYGLYDPPAAVPPVARLLPATTTKAALPSASPSSTPPATIPAADQSLPTPTAKSASDEASSTETPYNTAESDPETNSENQGTQIISVSDFSTQTHSAPAPEENQSVGVDTATNAQHISPTATLLNLGTVASAAIYGQPGGKNIVVGSQTVTQGGDAATISNVIISLGDQGLEVKSPAGLVTTIPIPTETAMNPTATLGDKPGSLTPARAPSVSAIPSGKAIALTGEMADPLSNGLVVTAKDGKLTTMTAGGHSLVLENGLSTLSVDPSLSAVLTNSGTTTTSIGAVANSVESVTAPTSQSSLTGSGRDSAATGKFLVSLSTMLLAYASSIAVLLVTTLT